ncbi:MAG: DUF6662 family protein [Hyalangium sp.]|uniref:DUF6662 family protein n=1 Tax=Hyalangium sp. TaxID=2028555 RepID=UPI003899F1E4
MDRSRRLHLALALASLTVLPFTASANERHFTYTYETAVLPPGGREVEVWTTARLGRDGYYTGFDERVEFEVGLTERLQTSLYLNLNSVTQRVGGELQSSTNFDGVSNEWKYKLMDPVADAFGLALYGELGLKPDELELEAKLILDKRIGPVLLAANLVLENGVEFEAEETEPELALELVGGASYFFTPHFSLGVEVRNTNLFPEYESWEFSALHAGPVVSYASDNWWVSLTVLPQLPALKRTEGGGTLVLTEHEKFNARLLFSFHL